VKLGRLDRRTLALLGAATLLAIILRFSLSEEKGPRLVAAPDSIPAAEGHLAKVRQLAATLPQREQALKALSAGLAEREKGVIQADTLAQAQAQLVQIVRRLTGAQTPPIEIRSVEIGQARPLGEQYGEIWVPLSFECRIEQLVQLLADMTAQPELLAVSELRISAVNQLDKKKDKTINVRLTFSGVVPRRLAPEKRGPGLL
jgi:hypothetical protein